MIDHLMTFFVSEDRKSLNNKNWISVSRYDVYFARFEVKEMSE